MNSHANASEGGAAIGAAVAALTIIAAGIDSYGAWRAGLQPSLVAIWGCGAVASCGLLFAPLFRRRWPAIHVIVGFVAVGVAYAAVFGVTATIVEVTGSSDGSVNTVINLIHPTPYRCPILPGMVCHGPGPQT